MADLIRKIAAMMQTIHRPGALYVNPIHMQFEPSSYCNLHCLHCNHAENRLSPCNATLAQFKKIFDSFKPLYLTLNGYGEPLICPELPEIIRYCQENGAKTNVTTNGLLLGKEAARLVDSGLELLNVSLDAATAATYKKIRGGSFSLVCDNIRKFAKLQAEKKTDISLRLSMVVQPGNVHETSDLIILARELGAKNVLFQIVETTFFADRADTVVGGFSQEDLHQALVAACRQAESLGIATNCDWLIENIEMLWQHHIKRQSGHQRQCWKPWHSVYVTADGFVRPCCNFVKDDLNFARFGEEGGLVVFNSPAFKRFRAQLGRGARPCGPCKDCVPETMHEFLFRKKF